MALDFPLNPTNGQIYGNYYYDVATASWRSNPLVSGSAFISDNVPAVSPTGSIWYNSTDGTLFVRYGNQWVEARSNQKVIPGSVIQTVQGTTTTQFSTSSTSFADTGLSATITPKFTNSKILVSVAQSGFAQYVSGNNEFLTNLVRGTTQLAVQKSQVNFVGQTYFGNTIKFLDSPGTSSPVTYKTQASTQGTHGGNTIFLQWPYGAGSPTSTITIMEVAQ